MVRGKKVILLIESTEALNSLNFFIYPVSTVNFRVSVIKNLTAEMIWEVA